MTGPVEKKAGWWPWALAGLAVAGAGVWVLAGAGGGKGEGGPPPLRVDPHRGDGKAHGGPLVEPRWEAPFRPAYHAEAREWVAPRRLLVLAPGYPEKYAQTLKEAYGGWFGDDDEAAVGRVFGRLRDKVQVSQVSKAFADAYGRGLHGYLGGFLNENEMGRLVDGPVGRLKKFRLA